VAETTNDIDRLEELHARFDALRGRMIDLDAIAHAAAESTAGFPYLKNPTDEERRIVRRMYSLVVTTANEAESMLDAMDDLIAYIECVMEQDADPSASADPDDDDEPGGQESPTFQ
jgi:hypothetical protein